MKDPSAPSSINVNKYFPQPRSIRIEGGGAGGGGWKRKNQLVESFAKKGGGRAAAVEGVQGGEK